jgi:hypothetical protein
MTACGWALLGWFAVAVVVSLGLGKIIGRMGHD